MIRKKCVCCKIIYCDYPKGLNLIERFKEDGFVLNRKYARLLSKTCPEGICHNCLIRARVFISKHQNNKKRDI